MSEWLVDNKETPADQPSSAPRTARDRARVEIKGEILAAKIRALRMGQLQASPQ